MGIKIGSYTLLLLLLAGCDSRYRYPCQDPANWDKLECNNDVCKAEAECTSDLTPKVDTNITTEADLLQDNKDEISNDCAKSTTETRYVDGPKQVDLKVVRTKVLKEKNEIGVMDPEDDEYEVPSRTPPSMDEEAPLTMNTIIDTAAHNAAIK